MLGFYCNIYCKRFSFTLPRTECSAEIDNDLHYIFTLVIGTLSNQNMFGTEQGLIK